MLTYYDQRQQGGVISGYAITARCLLFCIGVLAFSSRSMGESSKSSGGVTPAPVIDVVHIQPFTLTLGYTHYWRQERPFFNSGTLAVFQVDTDLVVPRGAAGPVLYAGNQTAQRLNHGHESGYVVAIIPEIADLAEDPVWFGSPVLPERVNGEVIGAERALANKAGILPFSEKRVLEVTQGHVNDTDLAALLRDHAAGLVLKYSPEEASLAETWQLPVAGAAQ